MKFGIIGAGPVGSILAAHLVEAGQEVHLVDIWGEHIGAILRDGLRVTGIREMGVRIDGGFGEIAGLGDVRPDYLVLSVKASALGQILRQVGDILEPGTILVSLQNGLDTEEVIAHAFDRHRVLRGVINYAGNITSPGCVAMHFFNKPNHIGCNCQKGTCEHAGRLADILTGVYLDTHAEVDIKRYVWEKAVLSAALSPISAVTGMTMREVMDSSDTYRIVQALLQECIEVAAASGFDFGPGFFNFCMDYLDKGGPHKPSMLVDLEAGRESEIDFTNGRIAYYGSLHDIPTPVNDMFTRLVKAFEHRNRGAGGKVGMAGFSPDSACG